jgi:hypothetical protein
LFMGGKLFLISCTAYRKPLNPFSRYKTQVFFFFILILLYDFKIYNIHYLKPMHNYLYEVFQLVVPPRGANTRADARLYIYWWHRYTCGFIYVYINELGFFNMSKCCDFFSSTWNCFFSSADCHVLQKWQSPMKLYHFILILLFFHFELLM